MLLQTFKGRGISLNPDRGCLAGGHARHSLLESDDDDGNVKRRNPFYAICRFFLVCGCIPYVSGRLQTRAGALTFLDWLFDHLCVVTAFCPYRKGYSPGCVLVFWNFAFCLNVFVFALTTSCAYLSVIGNDIGCSVLSYVVQIYVFAIWVSSTLWFVTCWTLQP